MTILNRDLNRRLEHLEDCALHAPEGTYLKAKSAAFAIGDAANSIRSVFEEYGFEALNDDRLRNIEIALYGYFLESNPQASFVHTAEGFGRAVVNPLLHDRVINGAEKDRDFLLTR